VAVVVVVAVAIIEEKEVVVIDVDIVVDLVDTETFVVTEDIVDNGVETVR
jgi:hypothetical protein